MKPPHPSHHSPRFARRVGSPLAGTLRRIAPDTARPALSAFAQLIMILIAAAVRHAITLPPKEGRRALTLFKRLLPKDLSSLK